MTSRSEPSAENYAGRLDAKGRCCGRKPMRYKGGSWRSPLGAPMLVCCNCNREYDPETGTQRPNWAFSKCQGCGYWIKGGELVCGECVCEEETP